MITRATIDWPEIKGISIGTCIETGRRFRRQAHAHNFTRSPHFGWICVLSPKRLGTYEERDGVLVIISPSRTMKHERAHLIAKNSGHGEKFIKALELVGNHAEARKYRQEALERKSERWSYTCVCGHSSTRTMRSCTAYRCVCDRWILAPGREAEPWQHPDTDRHPPVCPCLYHQGLRTVIACRKEWTIEMGGGA